LEARPSAAVQSFCPACGTAVDNPEVACASCFVSRASFPWDAVGQTVFIGSAREAYEKGAHDQSSHAKNAFIWVRCEAPEDAADTAGCRHGFNHETDDFIRSCAEGISQVHASITPESDGRFLVQNLSRTNPTRVDLENVPAQGTRALPGQRVALGQWDFVLGPHWPPRAFRRGTWRLPLRGLTVQARGRVLLDNVSLVAERSELVALMGPSGAGKTTLLYALARIKAPRDLPVQEDPARFWGSLGYVPQDDIIHGDLTVGQALRYACRLRLPAGTGEDTIARRITWALQEVGLSGKESTRIGSAEEKTLSGGERRRVSLAAALVSNPQVLILDEPTSGLSWTDATRVVDCLRSLAENRNGPGRTIIVTIHQPDVHEFAKFHQVAILAKNPRGARGARLVYFGPPETSYPFFRARPDRPPEIFDKIDGNGAEDVGEIADRFSSSILHQTFVGARLDKDLTELAKRRGDPPRRPSAARQLLVLLTRLAALRVAKWRGLLLLLVVALALGGLATLGKSDRQHPLNKFGCDPQRRSGPADACADQPALRVRCNHPEDPRTLATAEQVPDVRGGLLSMLMAVFLPLLVVSSGALVSERAIFRNESIAGVRAGPYLLARFIELFVIGNAFMLIVVAIAVRGLGVQGHLSAYLATGVGVVGSAVSLGLLISALVPRAELALWAVNLMAIPQMIFSGATARLAGARDLTSHLTVTRPALEALVKIDLTARDALLPCQVTRYLDMFPGYGAAVDAPLADLARSLGPFTVICLLGAYLALRIRRWREQVF
jgi:ABC-type multidrug transport system ATPase subunit